MSGRPVLIEKTFRKNLGERACIRPKCPNSRVRRDALLTLRKDLEGDYDLRKQLTLFEVRVSIPSLAKSSPGPFE